MNNPVLQLSKSFGGVTIMLKGKYDIISDGNHVVYSYQGGSPRRCGGKLYFDCDCDVNIFNIIIIIVIVYIFSLSLSIITGQGDVLSGTTGVFYAWAIDAISEGQLGRYRMIYDNI